jgi:translation initiation factor IF-3
LLQKLAEDIGELGTIESAPLQDGRNMVMVIGPSRKKQSETKRRPESTGTETSTEETGVEQAQTREVHE